MMSVSTPAEVGRAWDCRQRITQMDEGLNLGEGFVSHVDPIA